MRWYTAIGMKKDDADGRFCVWVDGEEKVLTEMETILWAALTWSFCEEDVLLLFRQIFSGNNDQWN